MSKILFVIPRMGGGGAERVVSVLANGLNADGYGVNIHTFLSGESFYPLSEGVMTTDCGIKSVKKGFFRKLSLLINFPKAFFRTRKLIKTGGYDVVISFLAEADIMLRLIKKTGVKFKWICSERNDPWQKSGKTLRALKKAYKIADAFVLQSQAVKDFYSEVSEEKKVIIFNPINAAELHEREEISEKKIISVGRLYPQKNFPLLINAFKEIHDIFPEYSLEIYGEGTERKRIERLITDLSAKDYVKLCGADKNVLNKVAKAELFVMTSDYEGFPNALLEAAAMGLPCISTDFPTGAAAEILPDSEAIVPVGDKNSLKAAITKMLTEKEFAKKCGDNNRKNCERFYTDKIISEWEKVIDGVIGK